MIKCWKSTTNSGNLMSSLRLASASQQSVSAWKVLRKENPHTPLGYPFSVPHKSTESPYGKSSLEGEIMHSRPSVTSSDSHLKFRAKSNYLHLLPRHSVLQHTPAATDSWTSQQTHHSENFQMSAGTVRCLKNFPGSSDGCCGASTPLEDTWIRWSRGTEVLAGCEELPGKYDRQKIHWGKCACTKHWMARRSQEA